MKKRYELEYSGASRMVIEIDDEVFTETKLREWNEFWSGHEERASAKNGPLYPLLKMTYMLALEKSLTSWISALKAGREEGFPAMDGSEGIEIISLDSFEFDDFEIDIKELA